jgi:type VI secretion system protein ImpH
MAAADRKTTDPLIQEIARSVHCYDFFQAVRLLQSHWRHSPRIGTSASPSEDPIRFGQRPSLAFSPSTLDALQDSQPPKLLVNFLGLFGPNGPLPFHLTEYAQRRQMGQREPTAESLEQTGGRTQKKSEPELPSGAKDYTFSAFLDVFHHRFISLFFRAWACHQQTVDFDRQEDQRFPFYIGSLFGLANEADIHGRFQPFPDALPLHSRLFYAGWLACPTRHAEGLEAILQDFFQLPTHVHAFVGRWFDLPDENRCILGESPARACLGSTAILGSRTWQEQLAFRIRFGPMDAADLNRMLPGGSSFGRLRSWVLHYLGEQYHGEIQLVVQAAQVPTVHLGTLGRLGWDSWLQSKPFCRDADDVIFELDRAGAFAAGPSTETATGSQADCLSSRECYG